MAKRREGARTEPSASLIRLAEKLFEGSDEREAFIGSLMRPSEGKPAVILLGPPVGSLRFQTPPIWLPEFARVVADGERPGKSPEHERGELYCLDASSLFCASVFSTLPAQGGFVVDLCAAPGGKSIAAFAALRPRFLLCNEVIRKRTAQLISNLRRCRVSPSVVTSLDPRDLELRIRSCADLVIVDAPCSGQSLLARGIASPGCFHSATVGMNAKRQRRILAHASGMVAPGGVCAYMTCTFSLDENERSCEWFLRKFPSFSAIEIPHLASYRSNLTTLPCYRLFPHNGEGSGGFVCVMKRSAEEERGVFDPDSVTPVWTSS
jgi:16S rRNA C967 or C1407 C5-methylase (RsmB/RsmF family)